MKRYRQSSLWPEVIRDDENGEWVRYEDVAALISVVREVEQEIEAWGVLVGIPAADKFAKRLRAALQKEGQP